mmetsp:Transcript_73355/g.132093  ORF Transcript_73355/g.132093 Transcript_73355/m.132093 type:complete len:181 (+) Transcript_73355:45-587(+)
MALMCRDELEREGIPMGTLRDWHTIHSISRPESSQGQAGKPGSGKPGANSPIRMDPSPSRRRDQAHKWVEHPNRTFGGAGLHLGQRGFLRVDTMNDWFKEFGRPIAIDTDVRRYAGALLRPAPKLFGDRKVAHLTRSLSRRRLDTVLSRTLPPHILGLTSPSGTGLVRSVSQPANFSSTF